MKNFLRLSIGLIVLIVPLLLVSNNSNAQENISDESALILSLIHIQMCIRDRLDIDVTWDKALAGLGFEVNENWDGESNMNICVVPEEILEMENSLQFLSLIHIQMCIRDRRCILYHISTITENFCFVKIFFKKIGLVRLELTLSRPPAVHFSQLNYSPI